MALSFYAILGSRFGARTRCNASTRQMQGQFLESCAQLLCPAPNFLTAFYSDEVEDQNDFFNPNSSPDKAVKNLGTGHNSLAQFLN